MLKIIYYYYYYIYDIKYVLCNNEFDNNVTLLEYLIQTSLCQYLLNFNMKHKIMKDYNK